MMKFTLKNSLLQELVRFTEYRIQNIECTLKITKVNSIFVILSSSIRFEI